jgi:hypothetical protein
MAKPRNILRLCALALPLFSLPASGEGVQFLEDGLPAAASDGRQFVTNRKTAASEDSDRTLYQVRCWQNGALIIDESHWRVPQIHSTFAAFRDAPQARPGLYLLEFGHALCQVKAQTIADEAPLAPEPQPARRGR